MKFVVDAHLPPGLCGLLQAAGHDALHTTQLQAKNPTTDRIINELSLRERRIVVTKDSDFYHSHLLRGEPWKLLLVCTGNIRTWELKELFRRHLPAIEAALDQNSLVELDRQTVRVVV
jgi:predicted nuclease of predicted toxin-antitoxin system